MTSSVSYTSDITYNDVTGLSLSFSGASRLYELEVFARISSGAGGIKLRLVYSGGTLGNVDSGSFLADDNTGTYSLSGTNVHSGAGFDTLEVAVSGALSSVFTYKALISITTAGTVYVQAAQNSSAIGSSTINRGSYIKATLVD